MADGCVSNSNHTPSLPTFVHRRRLRSTKEVGMLVPARDGILNGASADVAKRCREKLAESERLQCLLDPDLLLKLMLVHKSKCLLAHSLRWAAERRSCGCSGQKKTTLIRSILLSPKLSLQNQIIDAAPFQNACKKASTRLLEDIPKPCVYPRVHGTSSFLKSILACWNIATMGSPRHLWCRTFRCLSCQNR